MSALSAAVLAGGTAGLGLAVVLRELLPTDPHLGSALDRLSPARTATLTAPTPVVPADGGQTGWAAGLEHRAGRLAQRHLPQAVLARQPTRELALLRIPPGQHLGLKVLLALLGLVFPALCALMVAAIGLSPPLALPALASLVLAGVLFIAPDLDVHRRAGEARVEFARATSAYVDLTALERGAGAGATQALEQAATVGDSWVFVRLREQLIRARLTGVAPWDGLHELSVELGLPELTDLADIMRLSGEQGASVADTLRARSRGLRAALLTREQTRANEESERMVIPVAVLGLIFMVILGAPAIVRIL